MKLNDHALIYRLQPGQWRAARWHFGRSCWLPVMHIEGGEQSTACAILRAEPGHDYTIVSIPLDLTSETLESVDRFTALPSATVTCPASDPSDLDPRWRLLPMMDGKVMRVTDAPYLNFSQSHLPERIEAMKRPPRERTDLKQSSPGAFASLLRWSWRADQVGIATAQAA